MPAASARPPAPVPYATLATASLVAFAAIWGDLTREGLNALNSYPGQSIQPVIWAQAVGCFVMGWAIANKAAIDAVYPPLYVGITTGYCGSVTTFSSWVLQVFLAFSNHARYSRSGIFSVMDALTQTGATIGLALIALQAGRKAGRSFLSPAAIALLLKHPSEACRRAFSRPRLLERKSAADEQAAEAEVEVPTPDEKAARADEQRALGRMRWIAAASLASGPLFWVGSALLLAFKTDERFRHVTFTLLLAPPGALLRWMLSLKLNACRRAKTAWPRWPLGTLAANLGATLVIGGVYTAQHATRRPGAPGILSASTLLGCQALYGVQEGFCGCLSTISTFAVELETLRPSRRAFAYLLFSWLVGEVLCVLIVGVPTWALPADAGYARRCPDLSY